MPKKKVVIAGGGTGGHIYPGLAIADHLGQTHPEYEVHFVGAPAGLETTIVPRHGYPLHLLKIGRLHSSIGLWRRLKGLLGLPLSFIQALALYMKLRPQWVLGVGGFASAPFVFVASLFGAKTAILEPNAFPGMANRYLSKMVDHCFLVFEETGRFFPKKKTETVGLPVRIPKSTAGHSFDGQRKLNILVFGGSQGARGINGVVGDWLLSGTSLAERIQIVHQTGALDWKIWEDRYKGQLEGTLEATPYIHDMPERLAWADLCICRAGIGTVAEIAMSCTPALFIPLPTAADDHQKMNAETLVRRSAGMMIEQKDFTPEALEAKIKYALENPTSLKKMADALIEIDYSSAPQKILSVLLKGPS